MRGIGNILRIFIILLAVYLIGDGLIHLFNIRLLSVAGVWPRSAISFGILMDGIYASFVFLAAILVFAVQRDLKKYKTLVIASSIWAILHGVLLIFLTTTNDFLASFQSLPSLYVWMPFYNQYLLFEAFLAFLYALLVFIWVKDKK